MKNRTWRSCERTLSTVKKSQAERAARLGPEERRPGEAAPPRRRRDAAPPQHRPDGGRGHVVAELQGSPRIRR